MLISEGGGEVEERGARQGSRCQRFGVLMGAVRAMITMHIVFGVSGYLLVLLRGQVRFFVTRLGVGGAFPAGAE